MSSRFRRLRRCRALFALAMCAWLAMGSAAWALPGCCASMGMHASMAMHAEHPVTHPHGHAAGNIVCTCAHAAVDRLTVDAMPSGSPMPGRVHWRALPKDAPQPVFAPPLRPPSA